MLEVVRKADRRSWGILGGRFFDRWLDPDCVRQIGGLRAALHEALGMRGIGGAEDAVAMRAHRGSLTEVDRRRREDAEATVPMVLVVPAKKRLAERAAVFDRSEAVGELRTVC